MIVYGADTVHFRLILLVRLCALCSQLNSNGFLNNDGIQEKKRTRFHTIDCNLAQLHDHKRCLLMVLI